MTKILVLVNPCADKLNAISVRQFTLAPPSLAYLAALTPSSWDIKIIDENVDPITFEGADLVGITAMTCNVLRAYQISEQFRGKGVKTVIGGIHASILPDEAIRFADSVVIGEAESVWQNLLDDFERRELKPFYRGARVPLENLPKARIDLFANKYKIKASIQTARGCPMDCEFCSVTAFYDRTYRQRPVDEVLDEIESLDCKEFFFADDNLLNYGREAEQRAIRLFKGMYERGLKKCWMSQVGIDFADNPEILKWAQKSGCLGVHIGFESISEESLQGIRKIRNLKVGVRNYRDVISKIHSHGIGVHGAFVLGNDGDGKDIFERTVEFILNSKIDSASFTILTPLPGTRLYRRLSSEGRLLRTNYPEDWKYYDCERAVFKPKRMTPAELEDGVYRIYQQVDSRVASLKRAFNSFVETKKLPLSVVAYSLNRGLGVLATKKYRFERSMAS